MERLKFSGTITKCRREHNVLVRPPHSFSDQVADDTTAGYGSPMVHLAILQVVPSKEGGDQTTTIYIVLSNTFSNCKQKQYSVQYRNWYMKPRRS